MIDDAGFEEWEDGAEFFSNMGHRSLQIFHKDW